MNLSFTIINDILIASLSGRLDATCSEETIKQISSEIDKGYNKLILDLKEVEYLSSAGIRVLITVTKKIKILDGEIKISGVQEYPKNVLKMSGFLEIFNIYDTVEIAQKNFSEIIELSQTEKNIEVYKTKKIKLEFIKQNNSVAKITIIGDNQNFLTSNCCEENIVSENISELDFALGIGAVGQYKKESLDHLGDVIFVQRTAVWVQPNGQNIPDYLNSGKATNNIQFHSPYNIKLGNDFNYILRFEALDMNNGISLEILYSEILSIAKQQNPNFKGLISCVIRADVGEIFGATLKKSPIVANKPLNNESILAKDNIRHWLYYNLDAVYENSTALIVGVAMDDNPQFDKKSLRKIFHFEENEQVYSMTHNHGAFYKFISEERASFQLENEIKKVIANSELIGMEHLLDNSTLKKGIIGLNYIELIE